MSEEIKEKVRDLFRQSGLYVMSTISGDSPRSRFMTGEMNKDLQLRGVSRYKEGTLS